ncbi:MAG: flagellar protein FlgN [Cellvibrionaceae bacterium]|nr:flagellar protein FlgN [Cellvibrionaceae bacterium]
MNTASYNDICTMLNQDLDNGRQLLALLEQETAAVEKRNFDILQHLVNEKTHLISRLKKNAEQRSAWLHAANKPADEAHWLACLSSVDEHQLTSQWQAIKNTIAHCQAINDINGKVVQRGIKCHEQLLRLMRGNTQGDNLYNAKGKTQALGYSANSVQV